MELTWEVGDVARLAPIRRQLSTAGVRADLTVDDPAPLSADLLANGAISLWMSQSPDSGMDTRLEVGISGGAVTGALTFGFPGSVAQARDALVERVQAARDVELLLGPTSPAEIVARYAERFRPARDRDTGEEFTVDGSRVNCNYWDRQDGWVIPRALRITLPRLTSAVLAGSAGLWHPDRPVSGLAEAGRGVAAAERVAAYRPTRLELTIGPEDDDAGPGVLDAVLPLVGTDPLVVDWDCWFPGAVGGYNGVVLACNTTTRWERQPGVTEVVVSVNYKSPDEEVVHRIAEENGVHFDYLYTE